MPIDQARLKARRSCPGNVLRQAVADMEDMRGREAQVSAGILEDDRRRFGETNFASMHLRTKALRYGGGSTAVFRLNDEGTTII